MFISHLSLMNFRSYPSLELPLTRGTHIFLGENGEGKTNIIESILYLTTLSSHRVATDIPLIKLGADRAYIRAKIENGDRKNLIELEINNGKANRAKLNQNPVRSQREILGLVKAISFSPEDLDLVRGDPSERRAFLDRLLVQHTPRMGGVIADYERALKQRNTLLKARAPQTSLTSWDDHLITFGSELLAGRMRLIDSLTPHLKDSYNSISVKKAVTVGYKSSISNPSIDPTENRREMELKLEEVRHQERERGISLIGPHRDDLLLNLGDHPVKGYASHGESWSVALSLRLASYFLLKSEGEEPILILDDVFSELDEDRRERLASVAATAEQTLITVAVENDLPQSISAPKYRVKSGTVTPL